MMEPKVPSLYIYDLIQENLLLQHKQIGEKEISANQETKMKRVHILFKDMGVGLKLVKKFLTKNQGDIQVESEEGKGSLFTVSLPYLV